MKLLIYHISIIILAICCAYGKNDDYKDIINHKSYKQKNDSVKTLKEAYKNYFSIGTSVYYRLLQDNAKKKFISDQYSSITPENEMKPLFIHPEPDKYDFSKADSLVNFAMKHQMKVRGHCLIWFYRMPKWFTRGTFGNLIDKKELEKRMQQHISTIMNHYKGKVYCWDVVNEAVIDSKDDQIFRPWDELYKIAGEDYIEMAFRIAKKTDPKVKLFYNDNIFSDQNKAIKIYNLLKRLKLKGVPIDGIGIQGHYDVDNISEKNFSNTIKLFSNLGLEIQITELDMPIFDRQKKPDDLKNLKIDYKKQAEKQAEKYEMIFRICRETKNCTGITLWGAADWPNYLNDKYKIDGQPSLFDANMKPKKALEKIINL